MTDLTENATAAPAGRPTAPGGAPVLDVRGLRVIRGTEEGAVVAVDGLDLQLSPGETIAIVGESGSGKSSLAGAINGLLPQRSTLIEGEIEFLGRELLTLDPEEMAALRGRDLGMVFQDQAVSLNPMKKVGRQVETPLRVHNKGMAKAELHSRVISLLTDVGIRDPEGTAERYPHELSGGMRQRVLIAMAIANHPAMLIADEPTTALDVSTQDQVLKVLKDIQLRSNMAMLFITHNLEVVARIADRVVVMRRGRVVEQGTVDQVFNSPAHPYTRELLDAIPRVGHYSRAAETAADGPLALKATGVRKTFKRQRDTVVAVEDVSISVPLGGTVSIVGESGSGKTTLARCVAGLIDVDAGTIEIGGALVGRAKRYDRAKAIGALQFVFQDPFESLDPAWNVLDLVGEPLRREMVGMSERTRRVTEVLEQVSMPTNILKRRPREFSGGERQRLSIARAIVRRPQLLVLDEPTASLDVSIQAKVISLLKQIQTENGLSFLFITHDLALANSISDHVVVMRHGGVVEAGSVDDIFERPQQEYTRALLSARHAWKG